MSEEKFEQWCIIEIMGHQRLAGLASEFTLGGQSMVRVDVPAVKGRQAFTQLIGVQAIFRLSFVDKDVALAAAERLEIKPVDEYSLGSVVSDAVRNRLTQSTGRGYPAYQEEAWPRVTPPPVSDPDDDISF